MLGGTNTIAALRHGFRRIPLQPPAPLQLLHRDRTPDKEEIFISLILRAAVSTSAAPFPQLFLKRVVAKKSGLCLDCPAFGRGRSRSLICSPPDAVGLVARLSMDQEAAD